MTSSDQDQNVSPEEASDSIEGTAPPRPPSRIRVRPPAIPDSSAAARPPVPGPDFLRAEVHGRDVYVRRDAFAVMRDHAGSSDNEVGGFLIGTAGPDGERQFTVVEEAFPAMQARGARVALEIPPSAFADVHEHLDRRHHPDRRIIGWYHTHPGLDIFLSSYDRFLHQSFFGLPGQVAIVVDPRHGRHGRQCMAGIFVSDEYGAPIRPGEPELLIPLAPAESPPTPRPEVPADSAPEVAASATRSASGGEVVRLPENRNEESRASSRFGRPWKSIGIGRTGAAVTDRRNREREAALQHVGPAPSLPGELTGISAGPGRHLSARPGGFTSRPVWESPDDRSILAPRRGPGRLISVGTALVLVVVLLSLTFYATRWLGNDPPKPPREKAAAPVVPGSEEPSKCTAESGVSGRIERNAQNIVQLVLVTGQDCRLKERFTFRVLGRHGQIGETGQMVDQLLLADQQNLVGWASGWATLQDAETSRVVEAPGILGKPIYRSWSGSQF